MKNFPKKHLLQEKGLFLFLKLCRKKSMQSKLEELITLFFTAEEQENINARTLIIQALLKNEMTQREMASHFNISIGQITRGSNAIKTLSPELLEELITFFKEES